MSTQLHGLLIGAGEIRPVALHSNDVARQLARLIDCDFIDIVHLDDGIDIYVDDEGLLHDRPVLNLALTVVAHTLGSPSLIFGKGVVLGGDDENGDTLGLTRNQFRRVFDSLRKRPSPAVLDMLFESLRPFPNLVQMLGRSA